MMLKESNLKDKRVIIRADFNVPIVDGEITNNHRILKILPTINLCLEKGASIILISHLGRPEGAVSNLSLLPVCDELERLLDKNIYFSDSCISNKAFIKSSSLKEGEIHLLENLRFHAGENQNCPEFSKKLSFHGDVYINDAFGTAHREHASNVGLAKLFSEKYYGLLIEKELHYLNESILEPVRPMTIVMGGAKIDGKIELIEKFLSIADNLLIGGALSLPFLKCKGINIESTLVNNKSVSIAERLLDIAKIKGKEIILPTDFVTAKSLENIDSINIKLLGDIKADENCYDIGPETTMIFSQILSKSETILWNGPLGVSENPYFGTGTQQISRIIEELTKNGIISILGGGDTASAAKRFSISNKFTHISTGGGSSLELLSGKELPALKAIGYYDK